MHHVAAEIYITQSRVHHFSCSLISGVDITQALQPHACNFTEPHFGIGNMPKREVSTIK